MPMMDQTLPISALTRRPMPMRRPSRGHHPQHQPGFALVCAHRLVSILCNVMDSLGSAAMTAWDEPVITTGTRRQAQYGDTGGDTWFVKTLSGRTIAVHVRDGTVGGLRAAVAQRVGIEPADQVLAYAGRVVGGDGGGAEKGEGDERLAECGVPRGATLHLSLRLRGGIGAGQVLMLAQAVMMVYGPIRECIRSTWNSCSKEENQCPPRCSYLCPDPDEEESEEEDPEEPETGIPMRGNVAGETWDELRPDMAIWLEQHSADVTSGKIVEPKKKDEQHRHGRSLFNGNQKVWEIEKMP